MKTIQLPIVPLLTLTIATFFVGSCRAEQDPTERIGANAEGVNGVVYVMGGSTLRQGLSSVSAYIATNERWENRTSMPNLRGNAASIVLQGTIYMIGGRNENSVLGTLEKYDPREDKWTPGRPMPTPRWQLMAAAVNGKVYALGGISGIGNNRKALDVVEVYDPDKDTWETAGKMPEARHSAAIAVVGNKIYLISGKTVAWSEATSRKPITERVDCFDPVSNTWREVKSIPTGRTGARSVVFDDHIYVVGGIAEKDEFPVRIDVYDPKSNEWKVGPKIQKGRSGHACAILGNTIYIIGGSTFAYGAETPRICRGIEKLTIQ
jgi:N-acetylneuraminic acid mutarotase